MADTLQPSDDRCIYTIRLKKTDGTEQLLTRPCPYFSACKELGRTCADFQEQVEKSEETVQVP